MGRYERRHRGHRGWLFPLVAVLVLFQILKLAILLVVTVTQWALTLGLLDLLMIAALLGMRWIGVRAFRVIAVRWRELAEYHALEQQNARHLEQVNAHFNRLSVYSEDFDEVAVRLVELQSKRPAPPPWAFWIKQR